MPPQDTASSPNGASTFSSGCLGAKVRDALLMSESVIIECVNEVLTDMPVHKAEVFRRLLASSAGFRAVIKRTTIDVGIVLSLAKSFESDDTFADSASLVHDIRFADFDGKVGQYAKAMVESDLLMASKVEAGELTEDAMLYDLVPADVLRRRLMLLLAFMDESMKRAA